MELLGKGKSLIRAAAKADMDEKTARKYRELGKLPSDIKVEHTWRTRKDPFSEAWEEVKGKLEINPGLEAKTLFEDLQRRYPGQFADGQLRTLQRRVKYSEPRGDMILHHPFRRPTVLYCGSNRYF